MTDDQSHLSLGILAALERTHPNMLVVSCRMCGKVMCSDSTKPSARKSAGLESVGTMLDVKIFWQPHQIPLCSNLRCVHGATAHPRIGPFIVKEDDNQLGDVA